MNENLRNKILAKLDELPDETARQVLDYLEFLASKFNRSRRTPSPLKRLAENLEDALGGASLGDAAARGTAQVVDAASRVMTGLAAAGRAVADELGAPEKAAESEQQEPAGASAEEETEPTDSA